MGRALILFSLLLFVGCTNTKPQVGYLHAPGQVIPTTSGLSRLEIVSAASVNGKTTDGNYKVKLKLHSSPAAVH